MVKSNLQTVLRRFHTAGIVLIVKF